MSRKHRGRFSSVTVRPVVGICRANTFSSEGKHTVVDYSLSRVDGVIGDATVPINRSTDIELFKQPPPRSKFRHGFKSLVSKLQGIPIKVDVDAEPSKQGRFPSTRRVCHSVKGLSGLEEFREGREASVDGVIQGQGHDTETWLKRCDVIPDQETPDIKIWDENNLERNVPSVVVLFDCDEKAVDLKHVNSRIEDNGTSSSAVGKEMISKWQSSGEEKCWFSGNENIQLQGSHNVCTCGTKDRGAVESLENLCECELDRSVPLQSTRDSQTRPSSADNIYRFYSTIRTPTVEGLPNSTSVFVRSKDVSNSSKCQLKPGKRANYLSFSNGFQDVPDADPDCCLCCFSQGKRRCKRITPAEPPIALAASSYKNEHIMRTCDAGIFNPIGPALYNPTNGVLRTSYLCKSDKVFSGSLNLAPWETDKNEASGACLSGQLDLENIRLEVIVNSLRQMEELTIHEEAREWRSDVTVNAQYVTQTLGATAVNQGGNGMERTRPPRSGIPTFVGSNGGRVHSHERGDPGPYQSTARVSSLTTQASLQNKRAQVTGRQVSPHPPRRGLSVANGHVDSTENWELRSPPAVGHPGHCPTPKHPGHCPTPKHRPPPWRPGLTHGRVDQSESEIHAEIESSAKYSANIQTHTICQHSREEQTRGKDTQAATGQYGNADKELNILEDGWSHPTAHTKRDAILDSSLSPGFTCDERSNISAPTVASSVFHGNPSVNTTSTRHGLQNYVNENLSSNCAEAVGDLKKAVSSVPASYTTTRTSTVTDMDYPIRGVMCPLTNTVAVKRCVGNGDEVSFVFGRPVSPTSDHVRCRPHQSFANTEMARCMSASPVRYIPGHYPRRAKSPSSDILPMRRGIALGAYPARRVMSPPSVLGVGAAAEPRIHHQGGVCCERCNGCLVELKRQALRLMFPDNGSGNHLAQSIRMDNLSDRLVTPEGYELWYSRAGVCGMCETAISHLKEEAVAMIQSLQLAHTSTTQQVISGTCGHLPQPWNRYNTRQGRPPAAATYASSSSSPVSSSSSSPQSSGPLAAQAQAYLDENVRAYMSPKKISQIVPGQHPETIAQHSHQDAHIDSPTTLGPAPDFAETSQFSNRLPAGHYHPQSTQEHHPRPGYIYNGANQSTPLAHHVSFRGGNSSSPISSPTSLSPVHSVAASFFARAAQKLAKKKKRHHPQDQEQLPSFPTNFSDVIRLTPPPAPPCLIRTVGRLQNPGMGKVKVMLKICSSAGSQGEQGSSFISTDPRKKQVTVFDPTASGYVTSSNRRTGTAIPKMFAFDSVFTPDDSLTELCASSLSEIVQAVVAGADGCLFTYGYSKLGKTYTMIGSDQSPGTLGVMPCAIAWLFKLINEQKDKTGARFSVRVSAVQVTGKEEMLHDLLTEIAQGTEATGVGTAPSVYLREDPICGTQLENQSELRAPTADKAALYLDAALASRSAADEDEGRSSHMLFTLNVYQYRIEKSNTKAGLPGVAGGRSRLHLIDLGTASKSKDPSNVSLSLSALGNVIMALLNGQRHVPHRDSKIAQLLRDSLGNLSCRTCMIAHVSSAVPHYNETLQVIQLAARIHRMKRRRTKFSSTSSEDSSTDGDVKFRRPYRGLRMGTLREDVLYSSSHSDPDYTSSSEQSCDTVIYIGAGGQSLSDRELTDNEGPPRHVPRTNPRLPRRPSGSRSSGDDSDSGRSMHSVRSLESRLPVRSMIAPLPTLKFNQAQSVPSSPNPGLIKVGHRVGLCSKMPGAAGGDGSLAMGYWPDRPAKIHCHSSQTKLAKAIHDKQQPLEGEQWIDGPGVAIYPEAKSTETWVDGPPAFVVQQQPHSALSSTPASRDEHQHHHQRSDSSSKRAITKKIGAEEQWVDGPKEMVTENSAAQPMHTCSKAEHPSKPAHQKMSTGVNEKALKQALVKHIMETKDSPESSVSIDSNSSLNVEPPDSCSVSFHSYDNPSQTSGQVKDKVHGSNSISSDNRYIDASSSPILSTKSSKLESSKKINSSTQSPAPSPGPSPSVSRKCNKAEVSQKFQKAQLPSSGSPTHRVVQWIKSVSSKQQDSAESSSRSRRQDLGAHHPAQTEVSAESVTMTDAETNTEHDSDFEKLAEETACTSDSDKELNVCCKASSNVKCDPFDCDDSKCNIAIDTSLDSSFDTSIAIHDSIYEYEVEERLEKMKTKDGTCLASEVDNETFSNMSCSNRDYDELDRDDDALETDSMLVEHMKALTESKKAAQIARHIACNRHIKINPSDYNNEITLMSQHFLSRKPDGASNPNLVKVFMEEVSLEKSELNFLHSTSEEVMFVSANHGVDLPSTSFKSNMVDEVDEDSFCDSRGVSVQSFKGSSSTGYTPSPKLAAKNKPPLPTKLSPMLKQSGLPKPNSNSQPTISSPSRSTYCTAKPTHTGKDSPGAQQKTSPNGKTSGIPLSNSTTRSKFPLKDKTGASSSVTSHSTQSSATSSPMVSSISNSSSPSAIPKTTNSKLCNGASSKSCSSKPLSSSTTKDNGKSRKKEKEVKVGSNTRSTKLLDLVNKGKGNESDSGNDSGIVALERRLLSPYATVTKPRTQSHSSSGHGSDNSTISTEVHSGNSRPCTKVDNLHGGTSSGYESMLRDSEATGSSSGHEESGSESSSEGQVGSKKKGTRRSRSAPSRSNESSPVSSQPSQSGSRSAVSANKAWVDTRHLHKVKDEPLELKRYDPDDVERLGRRRTDEEIKVSSDIKQKNGFQRSKEEGDEISDSKDRIMMERNGWSFDCKFLMCFSCKSGQRGTDV